MDALEFAKELERMCNTNKRNGKCQNHECEAYQISCTILNLEKLLPVVEKWSAEHPIVRNVDYVAEMLEKAGYKVDKEYLSRTCPTAYSSQFAKGHCPNRYSCDECKKWWIEEYKGEENDSQNSNGS